MAIKSEKINKQIEWYYLLFCGLIYFLIVAHSNGKTMYWVPLILSGGLIWYFKKKYSFDVNELKTDLKYFCILWVMSTFLFFYFFIGFDLVPNIVNNDYHYNSALSDHLISNKSDFYPIAPLGNGNFSYNVFQFYHFTEIWITGILSKWTGIRTLPVLLVITYPFFLAFSLISIFKTIKGYLIPTLTINRFIIIGLIFLIFGTTLAIVHKTIKTPINVYIFVKFYAWFNTGILKLVIALPIVIYFVKYLLYQTKGIEYKIILLTIGFLYPTIIPILLSTIIGIDIVNKILTKRIFTILAISLIFALVFLQHLENTVYLSELIRTPKIYTYRLGILLSIVLYYGGERQFFFNILKSLFVISIITYLAEIIKVNFTNIDHVDYFQIFDNFNNPFAQLLAFLSVLFLLKDFKYANLFTILLLYTITLALTKKLQTENVSITPKIQNQILKLNHIDSKNVYVVTDTFDRSKNPYYRNPYMALKNTTIPWYVKNFKIIYAISLYPERDSIDRKSNEITKHHLNILQNPDSLKFYGIQNVVYQ